MSKEILLVVDVVSNEKDLEKEEIFEALELALEAATVKKNGGNIKARVVIDRATGDYETFRSWEVVTLGDEGIALENPEVEITLDEAIKGQPDIQVGDHVLEPIDSVVFGRIAAQAAKQVIIQKVREAERRKIVEAYKDRKGELITGVVKRLERGGVLLDLGGNVEAQVSREDMIPRESFRIGDRVRGYLKDVRSETRGPQLFISRSAPELIKVLFQLEVPEIGDGVIEIVEAARDPGSRAKIAVRSLDPRLDPIGSCVGMRGSRVQAVSNELAGERVDIILWDENTAQFVINSMSPAEISSIVVDEDSHSMELAVANDNLSQAIGRGGQNVRLASELTGWELNVVDAAEAEQESQAVAESTKQLFIAQLDVDEDIAEILVDVGFNSVEEIAYVPMNEMLEIEAFEKDLVEELRNRAKDAVLISAIATEEKIETREPDEDLLNMDGMDKELAYDLAKKDIVTMNDLAELSIDDLLVFNGIDEKRAGELIMKAREPWFVEDAGE
ncbi:MAG: transcription termination/antitermination protein NusA [Methylococcales bacterium]|jgi:N utilization substance protein A|nr:transcription termination/antitermination protein NusA [Methylococcales bacterium]MBT3698604.1 transcription termination/antitermination protein NusA [Methylococcales bacterium]MBT4347905.1 transcription termination/antitermination protein NusA [Methylococcales bacterium]MBT4599691.1 transcription termination/antitermination protein NusA [Methylococcales bacterium]MBT4664029.1 transcription termination/antitermination protein NusA [Methylococcales bacterium]